MRKRQIKAFTLVEIVIVLIVSSLLIGILFRVYLTTAEVSLRIKYQKQLGFGVVTMQTVMQNIIDTHSIDYGKFSGLSQTTSPGRTTTIPLVDLQNQSSTLDITTSGDLIYTTYSGSTLIGTASILGNDIMFSGATFIVSPVINPVSAPTFEQIYHPGFWLIGKIYPKRYSKINFPVHTFFSFLQK